MPDPTAQANSDSPAAAAASAPSAHPAPARPVLGRALVVLLAVLLLALAAAVPLLMQLAAPVRELFDFLKRLTGYSGVSDTLFLPLYKTIGIALIVRIGGNLCKDAGQNALASVLEFAGAICALVTALPLLSAVLDLLTELIW